MKNIYLIISVILLIAGSVFTGCENNRENDQQEVRKANQEMIDAQAQFEKEWQQFKTETELKIDANQKKIDDFKAAMKTTTAKFKAKYENQVLTLEQKNIELKKSMNEYRYEGKDNWEKFKIDFNREVDTIVVALNEIFTKKDQLVSDFSMDECMANTGSMIEAGHFIMLDELNTVSGNEFDRSYPFVQIVYPSNEDSSSDNNGNRSHPENGLTNRERRKYLFTISLNVDADY